MFNQVQWANAQTFALAHKSPSLLTEPTLPIETQGLPPGPRNKSFRKISHFSSLAHLFQEKVKEGFYSELPGHNSWCPLGPGIWALTTPPRRSCSSLYHLYLLWNVSLCYLGGRGLATLPEIRLARKSKLESARRVKLSAWSQGLSGTDYNSRWWATLAAAVETVKILL